MQCGKMSHNMSYLSLLCYRLFSVGCKHFPHVQYTIPNSKYEAQSGHCLFEEISWNSKISVLPTSVIKYFDSRLTWLISSDFLQSIGNIFQFGDFRIVRLIVAIFLFDSFPPFQQWSAECQEFESLHDYCYKSPVAC